MPASMRRWTATYVSGANRQRTHLPDPINVYEPRLSMRPNQMVRSTNGANIVRDKPAFADKHVGRPSEHGMSRRAVLKASAVGSSLLLGFTFVSVGVSASQLGRYHSRKRLCAQCLPSYQP